MAMFSGAVAENLPFVNRPSDEPDGPGIPQPPKSYTERRRIADYRRSGEHRDLHTLGHTGGRRKRDKIRSHARRGDQSYEKFSAKMNLICCVFDPTTHDWKTTPVAFDRLRDNDRDVWFELRRAYRDRLQMRWRRIFLFKRLSHIVPIEYTHNGVPIRTHPDSYPNRHTFMHAYHHPQRIRPDRYWIDWLVQFRDGGDSSKTYGLEFVESLWIEKLAVLSILLTFGLILACILWVTLGGDLGTVFTVMDFVESGIAAIIALIALYYQAVLVS